MTNSNSFLHNHASNAGGAIKWNDLEPIFKDSTNFLNNSAGQYGDDIACFA